LSALVGEPVGVGGRVVAAQRVINMPDEQLADPADLLLRRQ
jgi:hypothetical protein